MSLQTILRNFKPTQDILNDYLYIVVPVVMSSVNKPKDIQQWYNIISERIEQMNSTKEEKDKLIAKVVLRLREAILKSFIIVGFPKTINALQELYNATPDHIRALLPNKPLRKEENWQDVLNDRKRGKDLFTTIYDRHTDRVIQNMSNTHPDLAQTALFHLYSSVLGETAVLNAKDTSLITCAALMIQNIPLQLKGHSYGALHNGATKQDILRIQSIVETLADYYHLGMAKL